jgi:L-rhamnose mutarotase
MQRVAFRMQLKPGFEAEYQKRHEALWPELHSLLKNIGVANYSISLDTSTLALYAFLQIENPDLLSSLPAQPVMQRWWAYMAPLMEVDADLSPKVWPLNEVFYME